jgi:hypothetical protein
LGGRVAQPGSGPFTRICPTQNKPSKSAVVRGWWGFVSPSFHHRHALPLRGISLYGYSALAVAEKPCGCGPSEAEPLHRHRCGECRDFRFLAGRLPSRARAALTHPSQSHGRALTHDVSPLAYRVRPGDNARPGAPLLSLACNLDHARIATTCAAPYPKSCLGEISATNIPARSPV